MKLTVLALSALMLLSVISTTLSGALILDSVNRKLPKEKRLSWFRRVSIIEACDLYGRLYPRGRLTTVFWTSFVCQFVLIAGIAGLFLDSK